MTAANIAGKLLAAALAVTVTAGCTVGPDYRRPSAPAAARFKELKGWKRAHPADAQPRGAWWRAFRDPALDKLEAQVDIGNQNLKAAAAAYAQARALVGEAKAGLFPTVGTNGDVSRQRSNGIIRTSATLEATASWDLDLWGRIRRDVESQAAAAQASAADLAAARLSAQAMVATLYLELRYQDSLSRLLASTVSAYRRSLTIAKNQFSAGVAAQSDVLTAQTQLETTQAQLIGTGLLRAQYEHAIAVLIGKPPSDLAIASRALPTRIPQVPVSVPSTLLERRPDIAAAERRMQQQNALIGVATAAFFPDVNLSAAIGAMGNPAGLFGASGELWSLAASGAETLFAGGGRIAAVKAARAAYQESVAQYRQSVLGAFQEVEDALSNLRILGRQAAAQNTALGDARRALQIALNEYQAGTTTYTTVVTAQATALGAEQSVLSVQQSRFVATVALINALGGGWHTGELPPMSALTQPLPSSLLGMALRGSQ